MADAEQCLTCTLPDATRVEVEARIRRGETLADVRRYLEVFGDAPSDSSLRRHRDNHMGAEVTREQRLGKIVDLLEKSGIDVEDIGAIDKVTFGTYQAITKDADGEAEVHDLEKASIVVSPKWSEGPAWPVVNQASPTVVNVRAPKAVPADVRWKRAVILPDIQAGFFRDLDDKVHPIHDVAAIDVALQVVSAAQPDLIVMVGDGADFAEMSRFRLTPAFARLTQATIDWVESFVARLRALCPDARIAWIAGNHESRVQNYLLDNAVAAFGLRRGNAPESWPVMSFPYLCRFEDHGIEWVGAYPAGEFWINDRLRVIHGDKVSSNSTAHKYLDEDRVSTIFGHVHRREHAERTRHTRSGPRTIMAMSPGCLCRVDGAVPSTKQGIDDHGLPAVRYENWQQGVAVVEFEDGDGRFSVEQVAIHDGWARWRGTDYRASADREGNPI